MTNIARIHAPGTLVHVITRIVNREFRIGDTDRRRAYLERIPLGLERSDWIPIAYAVMSNHIHLVLVAGHQPPQRFYQSVHGSFARWLNARDERIGPVFAARPRTIHLAPIDAAPLVAYVHNNPVRAGVAASADESSWTSHRAWTGDAPPPDWLNVGLGLRACGFDLSRTGRGQFNEFVRSRQADRRDAVFAGDELLAARRDARASLGLPVELSSPLLDASGANYVLTYLGQSACMPRWRGDLGLVLDVVAGAEGLGVVEILSRHRRRALVRARKLAAIATVVWLRRTNREAAALLGLNDSSVCEYLDGIDEHLVRRAAVIADAVRGRSPAVHPRPQAVA